MLFRRALERGQPLLQAGLQLRTVEEQHEQGAGHRLLGENDSRAVFGGSEYVAVYSLRPRRDTGPDELAPGLNYRKCGAYAGVAVLPGEPGVGVAAAKARGQVFGRRRGYRPSDKHAGEVMRLIEEEGYSQRRIAERLVISKTTVNEIVKRSRQEAGSGSSGTYRRILRSC